MTARCPITGQPDFYRVSILVEATRYPESKSLKLYLQQYREEGLFCEAFAARIAADVKAKTGGRVEVEVEQKPRGGIAIVTTAGSR